jgi:hypothetical protein
VPRASAAPRLDSLIDQFFLSSRVNLGSNLAEQDFDMGQSRFVDIVGALELARQFDDKRNG